MPKHIILKTLNPRIHAQLISELSQYSKIHFTSHQINGEYCVAIKCNGYYEKVLSLCNVSNIYFSYIYLYTTISFVLCNIIIDHYEALFISHHLKPYQEFFSAKLILKIKTILSFILDANYPSPYSKKICLYRRDLIFHELILLFRKQNHINIESFALFGTASYHDFLEKIIEISFSLVLENDSNEDFINFILNNLFK